MPGNTDGNIMGIKPVVGSKSDLISGNTVISLLKKLLNHISLGGYSLGFSGAFDVYSSDTRAEILDIQSTVDNLDDSIFTLTETGSTLTTDGTEQTIYINDTPTNLFTPSKFLMDFTAQTGAETIVIKEYYRIKSGGNYIKYNETTYTGTQDPDLVIHNLSDNRYGIKITAEKTGGVNKDYDWEITYKL